MTDPPPGPGPRFEILGGVRALRDGHPADLGPAEQQAVLAALLLRAGSPVPGHDIVAAVWAAGPPPDAADIIARHVAGLRQALDSSGLIATVTGGYALRLEPGTLDAERFHTAVARAAGQRRAGRLADASGTLREALDLWRGEALAGLDGPVFATARHRLADAQAAAWEEWADIELARGHHTDLVPDLDRLIERFPLREGLRAHLMIALHRDGRQAEALAAFRDARADSGAEPGERLREAHRRILRGEPFYAEPVDPWSDGDDPPPPPVPPYVPPDVTAPVPDQRTVTGPAPWPAAPPAPPGYSSRPKRFPVGEVIAAALLPIVVCSFGSWVYFVYAGIRRQDRRQFLVALGYALLFATGVVLAALDPSPQDSQDLNPAEWAAFTLFAATAIAAAVHGAVLASHPGDDPRHRGLRDQARQLAAFDPARARSLGIGRPDLLRAFDDGGLVDVNHVPGQELARLPGISSPEAHRIVVDRLHRGPYARVEDLVTRGLLPAGTLRRLAPRLICVPLAPTNTPAGGWPGPHQRG